MLIEDFSGSGFERDILSFQTFLSLHFSNL